MANETDEAFRELERQKDLLLADVSGWPVEHQRFRPDATNWSALEVIDHLAKVEKSMLEAVRLNLPEGHPVQFKERCGALMVNAVMRTPMRIKVPAGALAVLPENRTDLAAITVPWSEVRRVLAQLLQDLTPRQLGTGLFRHPVSGWMTMPLALGFLSAHLYHHGYQLKKLKRASM